MASATSGAQPRVASANTARAVVWVLRRPSTTGKRTPVSTFVAVAEVMTSAYLLPVSTPSRSDRVGCGHGRRRLGDELRFRTARSGDDVLEQREHENTTDRQQYGADPPRQLVARRGGNCCGRAVVQLAGGVPQRERDEDGQPDRTADLLHRVLHTGRERRVLTRHLVQRRVADGGEADAGEETEQDHARQDAAGVRRPDVEAARQPQPDGTPEDPRREQRFDADTRHQG